MHAQCSSAGTLNFEHTLNWAVTLLQEGVGDIEIYPSPI